MVLLTWYSVNPDSPHGLLCRPDKVLGGNGKGALGGVDAGEGWSEQGRQQDQRQR